MNPRKFLNFLRSKTGLLILFLLAASVVLILVNSRKGTSNSENSQGRRSAKAQSGAAKPQLLQRIARQMVPFRPPQSDEKAVVPPIAENRPAKVVTTLPPLSIIKETPANESKAKKISDDYAPFGRLIPCELIVTVDSSSINTPVIGLVTEDVYHHGRIIVPAGTEVHGTAQVDPRRLGRVAIGNRVPPERRALDGGLGPSGTEDDDVVLRAQVAGGADRRGVDVVVRDPVDVERLPPPWSGSSHTRERIASNGRWNLVWQSGEELRISGLALDREQDADGSGWGITDGSAGLRGRLIKSDNLAEIKMFAATLLSGMAGAFTERQTTAFGSFAVPSLTNAPLEGAQSVLDRYAQQIQQSIERDGFYVRVPAGKQFYLYVTQTLDRADARIGGETTENRRSVITQAPLQANVRDLQPQSGAAASAALFSRSAQ